MARPKLNALEVRKLVPLLKADWESPEHLAQALVEELDNFRADKTSYVGVMQFGGGESGSTPFYVGLGPYPGYKSALNALRSHPAAPMALKSAVVPMMNAEGLREHLKKVG